MEQDFEKRFSSLESKVFWLNAKSNFLLGALVGMIVAKIIN